MAERRMFTKKITDGDEFTSMPPTTQCLYFHLCMNCDDDGFTNKVRVAMFNAHASTDDMKTLVEKRFVIPFESGIIVIKHWRMHNYIRKDTYSPTKFEEEKSMLTLKDNGVYTERGRHVDEPSPQDSIGKDSIGNNNILCAPEKGYSNGFEIFWSHYPRKVDKAKASKCYQARLKDGWSEEELLTAAKNYAEYCKKNNTETKYIKHGATFLAAGTPFTDYLKKGEANESGVGNNETDTYTESRNRLLERYGIMS